MEAALERVLKDEEQQTEARAQGITRSKKIQPVLERFKHAFSKNTVHVKTADDVREFVNDYAPHKGDFNEVQSIVIGEHKGIMECTEEDIQKFEAALSGIPLQSVELESNTLSSTVIAQTLLIGLARHKGLETVKVAGNTTNTKAAIIETLAMLAKKNHLKNLKQLVVSNCEMTDDDFEPLLKAMDRLPELIKLIAHGNKLTVATQRKLKTIMWKRRERPGLHLHNDNIFLSIYHV